MAHADGSQATKLVAQATKERTWSKQPSLWAQVGDRLDKDGLPESSLQWIVDASLAARRRLNAYIAARAPKEMTSLKEATSIMKLNMITPLGAATVFPESSYAEDELLSLSVVPFSARLLHEVRADAILFPGLDIDAMTVRSKILATERLDSHLRLGEYMYRLGARWYLLSRGSYTQPQGLPLRPVCSQGLTRREQIDMILNSGLRAAPLVELAYLDVLLRKLRGTSILSISGATKLRCQWSHSADQWNARIAPAEPNLILYEEGGKLQIFSSAFDDDERRADLGLAAEYMPAY